MNKKTLKKIEEIENNISKCRSEILVLERRYIQDFNVAGELAIALKNLSNYQYELIQIYKEKLKI